MLHYSTELQLTSLDLMSIAPNWYFSGRIFAVLRNHWTCNNIMSLTMGREPTIGHQYSTNQAIDGKHKWQGQQSRCHLRFQCSSQNNFMQTAWLTWPTCHLLGSFLLDISILEKPSQISLSSWCAQLPNKWCTQDFLDIFCHSQQHELSRGQPATFWAQWQQLARSVHALPRRRLQP